MPLGGCGRGRAVPASGCGGPSSSSPVGPVDGRPEQRALRGALSGRLLAGSSPSRLPRDWRQRARFPGLPPRPDVGRC